MFLWYITYNGPKEYHAVNYTYSNTEHWYQIGFGMGFEWVFGKKTSFHVSLYYIHLSTKFY